MRAQSAVSLLIPPTIHLQHLAQTGGSAIALLPLVSTYQEMVASYSRLIKPPRGKQLRLALRALAKATAAARQVALSAGVPACAPSS